MGHPARLCPRYETDTTPDGLSEEDVVGFVRPELGPVRPLSQTRYLHPIYEACEDCSVASIDCAIDSTVFALVKTCTECFNASRTCSLRQAMIRDAKVDPASIDPNIEDIVKPPVVPLSIKITYQSSTVAICPVRKSSLPTIPNVPHLPTQHDPSLVLLPSLPTPPPSNINDPRRVSDPPKYPVWTSVSPIRTPIRSAVRPPHQYPTFSPHISPNTPSKVKRPTQTTSTPAHPMMPLYPDLDQLIHLDIGISVHRLAGIFAQSQIQLQPPHNSRISALVKKWRTSVSIEPWYSWED